MSNFLPETLKEARSLGWKTLDVIIINGDAHIDHHSFGAALIGRYLVENGYKVGIISQPDINRVSDFRALGKPNLFFGVTSGNVDSIVNHYTAQRKIRSEDNYSPDGIPGKRPDRAVIVYTQKLKQLFKGVPVVIGGIEASLRRIAHYDYLQDKVRKSVLFDSKADLLIYGMAEKTLLSLADMMSKGETIDSIKDLKGTVTTSKKAEGIILPDTDSVTKPSYFVEMTRMFEKYHRSETLYQEFGNRYLKHNPPPEPLTTSEIDRIYNLPFNRQPHPKYKNNMIPAFQQIKDSITTHRGCFGGCSFCSIFYHQGSRIQSRSRLSIIKEAKRMISLPGFKGVISDVGGPSADMYGISCSRQGCARKSCLRPEICPDLDCSHREYLSLLEELSALPQVRHLFINSGIRTDLAAKSEAFIEKLAKNHTSGRIKVAPEHTSSEVLEIMNKQGFSNFEQFVKLFNRFCRKYKKKHQVIPYLMVGHPGTTLNDSIDLAVYLKRNQLKVEQVQEFTPTPMTISTAMYYTGINPHTGKTIYVPKGRDIRLQKALAQWFIPSNKKLVIEALKKAGRKDLVSFFYPRDNK